MSSKDSASASWLSSFARLLLAVAELRIHSSNPISLKVTLYVIFRVWNEFTGRLHWNMLALKDVRSDRSTLGTNAVVPKVHTLPV